MRRLPLAIATAISLAFGAAADSVSAQQCQSPSVLANAAVGYAGYVCVGGGCGPYSDKVRIRVKVNASGTIYNKAVEALQAWNGKSDQTNHVFVWNEGPPDLYIEPKSDSRCGTYHDNKITYEQNTMNGVVAADPSDAKTIFVHELGHYLGLDEGGVNPTPATVMNRLVIPSGWTCAQAFGSSQYAPPTVLPTSADALKAGQCAGQAHASRAVKGDPPDSIQVYEPSGGNYCYATYSVTYVFNCHDREGCYYVDEIWILTNYQCA